MAENRWPLPETDLAARSIANGINDSTAIAQLFANTQLIADLIADVRPAPQNIITRSDSASQVITVAKMLRGGVFVNYTTTPLYLQIHGVTPAPAAAVQPQFPPIPVAQNQVFLIDQALLGYDGFGYTDCTIRVSSTLIGYTPTANTAGLWAMIARFK
jgi:hypothetical protein